MTEEQFANAIDNIYAIFNIKTTPSDKTLAVWLKILKQHVPSKAVVFIRNRILQMERLPTNMVQTWLSILPEFYVAYHINTREKKAFCEFCNGEEVRWCWAPMPGDRWRLFASPCPVCRAKGELGILLDSFLKQGVKVMPADYPGGVPAFDRDNKLNALCKWE